MAAGHDAEGALLGTHLVQIEHRLHEALAVGVDVEPHRRWRFDLDVAIEAHHPVLIGLVQEQARRAHLGAWSAEIGRGDLQGAAVRHGPLDRGPELGMAGGADALQGAAVLDALARRAGLLQPLGDGREGGP